MSATRRRVLQLAGLGAFGLVGGKLAWIQVSQASSLASQALQERTVTWINRAPRGDIVARDGQVLATSAITYDIGVNQIKISQFERTEEYKDPATGQKEYRVIGHGPAAAAQLLAPVLGRDPQELGAQLVGESTYRVIAEDLPPDTWREVKALGIPGVEPDQRTRRVYPADTLAGNVLGFTTEGEGRTLIGAAGLEMTQNDILTGKDGKGSVEVGRSGAIIPTGKQEDEKAISGETVKTTLHPDLQAVAQQAIDAQVKKMSADWGSVVVMDPATGKLLVMADSNSVNPSDPGATPEADRRCRIVEAIFEPGSVGKVVTFATALHEGTITPEQKWTIPDTWTAPNGQVFEDSHSHPVEILTTAEVLAESSNVGTVQIGDTVSDQARYDMMHAMGWGEKTGIQMPAESAGILLGPDAWDGRQRYTTMFGQGVATTALQSVAVLATVANKGVRVPPRVIESRIDHDGVEHPEPQPEGIRVLDEQHAALLTDMLIKVTEKGGTAEEAALDGYLVAGKTGTTEILTGEGGTVASFVGFMPAKDPVIAIAVTVYHPRAAIYGGEVAGPVFREVALAAMHALGVAPDPTVIAQVQSEKKEDES
ncbi:peptidoglycan D,D-transpeptidase FtsI family protein [Actinomyces vulturis]|uniref:peptidoglycan D,D-transpeptidase FtsI family protein n=1 Tax=Actinomyces vulturis TaxID=1857645 RepID=UPI00082DD0C9|nr:penicillin-binding protein 2 [Actinomyces vulturis]